MTDNDWLCDAYPPDCGPPSDIYFEAVPIWTGMTHNELAARLGAEYACGVAWGFESAIVMSCLKPEWARGLYLSLREHYATDHTEDEIEDWVRRAEETARAIPVYRLSPVPPLGGLQGFVPSAAIEVNEPS